MGKLKEIEIEIQLSNDYNDLKAQYNAFNKKYPKFYTFEQYLFDLKSRN